MELGTDDEKALIKALKYSFPNSTRYLCTKHYMTNKETILTKERETITQLILDTNDLCNANDMFTFEQISSQITSTTSNTQIIDYYNNLFKTRVNYYVRQVCGPTTMPNLSTKSVRSTLTRNLNL